MRSRVIARLLVLACAVGLATSARAEDELHASAVYGRGIHNFNSGDYEAAYELFSKAIEMDGRDPRYHLFRGLAADKLGRTADATRDFQAGAAVEAEQPDQPFGLNDALERIQGPVRVEIERARNDARLAAKAKQHRRERARYEELVRREDVVLVDPDRPVPSITIELPESSKADPGDPFLSGMAFSGGQATKPTEKKTAPVDLDPFGDGGNAADPLGGGNTPPTDPFGGEPPKVDSNPFGDAPPDNSNPGDAGAGPTNPLGSFFKILDQATKEQGSRDPFGEESPPADPGNQPNKDPFGTGNADDQKNDDPFKTGNAGSDQKKDPFDQ